MKRIIDLDETGLEALMPPQHAFSLRFLWKNGEPANSRQVWTAHNEDPFLKTMSRASIINCLNDLVEHGFLDFDEETCKGGTRRVYRSKITPAKFAEKFLEDALPFIKNIFDDPDWWIYDPQGGGA